MRRLVKKLGLTLIAAALVGSGVAFADTGSDQSSPGVTQESSQQTSVTVESNNQTSVEASVTQQSSQSVGGSSDNQQTSPTSTPSNSASNDSSGVQTENNANDGSGSGSVAATQAGDDEGGMVGLSGPLADSIRSAITKAVASGGSLLPLTPVGLNLLGLPIMAVPADTHLPGSEPGAPTQPISGLLQELRGLLADVFVPAVAHSTQSFLLSGVPIGSALVVLALFALSASVAFTLMDVYIDRLRRGGYLGAPRSHVTANFSFATPLKWVLFERFAVT